MVVIKLEAKKGSWFSTMNLVKFNKLGYITNISHNLTKLHNIDFQVLKFRPSAKPTKLLNLEE